MKITIEISAKDMNDLKTVISKEVKTDLARQAAWTLDNKTVIESLLRGFLISKRREGVI